MRHPVRPVSAGLTIASARCHQGCVLKKTEQCECKAGLHPTALRFVASRAVAALGSDGNTDTAPSTTEGVDFPIHALAIAAMGLHLLDYLQFEELAVVCERARRWEFLFVAAPLRIVGGTGSPVNPLAVL